jgi:predicted GNAT family N-acyltransferase
MIFQEIGYGSEPYRVALQLRHEVLRAPLGLNLFAEDLSCEASQTHFGLFTASSELAACVTAVPLSSTHVKIRQMAVHPDHQRCGHGTCLIRSLELHLGRDGFTDVSMHARVTAVPFYEQLEYSVVGARFAEVGLPHLQMQKSLSPHPSEFSDRLL